MSRTLQEWTILARTYLAANSGRQILGMTHNANNFCHVLEMQLELFRNKIKRQPTLEAGELVPKFSRLTQAVEKLAAILKDNELHTFYTEEETMLIDVVPFIEWFTRFWNNNLFFKHKITTTITCADNLPPLKLPPFVLTLCLDEALKNVVEACSLKNPKEQHGCSLDVQPQGRGVVFSLTSPTPCPTAFDPWAEGTTSQPDHLGLGLPMARALAENEGWHLALTGDAETTTFQLKIPEKTSK